MKNLVRQIIQKNNYMSIYHKKISVGAFAKKGIDINDGDILIISNEGKQLEGEFGIQNVFLIKLTSGEEKNVSINATSLNGLIDAFGEDSLKWIGKEVKAHKIKQNVAGKFIDVWYFSHKDAELTENGFILPGKDSPSQEEDIPTIEEEDNSF